MEVVTGPDFVHTQTLNRLVEQYQTDLLRMCYLYLHDAELARDAVQETYLKAYRALDSFRGECGEKTWLMKIAMNTCRDLRRSAWFRHIDRRVTPDMMPSAFVAFEEKDEEVLTAVMALPVKLRESVLLYFYQDMFLSGYEREGDCAGAGRVAVRRFRTPQSRQKEAAYRAEKEALS